MAVATLNASDWSIALHVMDKGGWSLVENGGISFILYISAHGRLFTTKENF